MADMLKLYKMCIKDAEERYKRTGVGGYLVIAERLKEKVLKMEHERKRKKG